MKFKITLLFILSIFFIHQSSAQCGGATHDEVNGVVVIEMESGNLPSGWIRETGKAGYTGSSFIAYRGPNYFNAPGNQVITYKIRINTPGTYRFQFKNTIGVIASHDALYEHNDSWIRIPDASNFWAQQGGSILYPKGSGKVPNPIGSGGLGYFKVNANSLAWNWDAWTNDGYGHNIYASFTSPGIYTVEIAGRSNGHFIDRMVLFDESRASYAYATSTARAETLCSGSPPPPPPPPPPPGENNAPTVSITSPSDGQNFNPGSTVTVGLSANDSDGNITLHEIFVNNVKVDNDGAFYSPYSITNIASGTYAIRATVTDNGGKTASSTVNITVGDSNPPPPPPPPTGGSDPTVSINSPADGQSFNPGSNVSVGLSAGDSDGSIVKHEIFVNNVKVDTDGVSYTPHIITNITEGSYAIRATVTDNAGNTASSTVNITVGDNTPPPPPPPPSGGDPTVSITNPSNGQNFNTGSTVSVGVSASDTGGSIVKHEIFVNDVKVDTDGANYTPHPITNIAAGSYAIRATVTDNEGNTASTTVNITAGNSNPPPPPSGDQITIILVDANSNQDVHNIINGTNIANGSNKNIRTSSSFSGTKSVYFELQGPANRIWTENVTPFALYGDVGGSFNGFSFPGGSYTLTVEAYSGSNRTGSKLATKNVYFTVGSGIDGKAPGLVYVYPNPIRNGKFSVQLPKEVSGDLYYSLISTSGSEVETGKINVARANDKAEFNLESFNNKNNGVYYLIIQAKEQRYTVPIIKK